MRNPKMVLSIMAAMALLAATAIASAGGWGGCGCHGHDGVIGNRHGAWLSKLDNVTKEQKGGFDKLHNEFMKGIEALRSQNAQKRIELAELSTKSPQDEAAIQKKKEEVWALKDQMGQEGRAFRLKVRALLTPEQREQLRTIFGFGLVARIPDLTKAQKEKIDSLRIDFLKKKLALRSQKGQRKIELVEFMSKSPQDETAIEKKKEVIWALKDQMRKEGRAFGTSIRSILTPEQKEKLEVWTGPGHGFSGHGRGMM